MPKDQAKLLFEIASEVCFKMGGIHTVIVSKIPYLKKLWGDHYFLIGAYIPGRNYDGIFRPMPEQDIPHDAVKQAIRVLKNKGLSIHAGVWLTEGHPPVLLVDPTVTSPGYDNYLQEQLKNFHSKMPPADDLIHLYIRFGYCLEFFFKELCIQLANDPCKIIVHFHEYMTTIALPAINKLPVRTVFTVHATVMGRCIASHDKSFHKDLATIDWQQQVQRLSDYHRCSMNMERIAARYCHILTTVSDLVARECSRFLDRIPDVVTPNGLNTGYIQQEVAGCTISSRKAITQAVGKHFAADPALNTGRVWYFFTSGRYEYTNKGYDIIIQALAKLNRWILQSGSAVTVIMFFITDTPFSFGPAIKNKLRRLKDACISFLRKEPPDVFLYKVPAVFRECRLVQDLKTHRLTNKHSTRVKIAYHPQFLSGQGPVFKLNYLQFSKGCDLGIFPSHYEPWGYTPVECISASVPAVTTNVTGFGNYAANKTDVNDSSGIFILDRNSGHVADELYTILRNFITEQKNYGDVLKEQATLFDWDNMISCYGLAYEKALESHHTMELLG
jgi:glycogen synthase